MAQKVRKAVITAAGFGTRFLPQTKAMPKEMLPLVDKPVIQHIIEELVQAGIEDIILVTGYHKRSIEDHFDGLSSDLKNNLILGGKQDILEQTEKIQNMANFIYVRQKGPYGNGTPILCADHLVGDEPFLYVMPDDFFLIKPNTFERLIKTYEEHGCSVVSTFEVTEEIEYKRYGIIGGEPIGQDQVDIKTMIEKPGKEKAVGNLANAGAYLFTPDMFEYTKKALDKLSDAEELHWNNAAKMMLADGKRFIAQILPKNAYFDTGNKLGYLKALFEFALTHPEVGEDFREYIKSRV
jgi:UTP--glucose-1-phosphate uridylyltransferase